MSKWNYKGLGMMVHESFMVDKNEGKWKPFPCIGGQKKNFVSKFSILFSFIYDERNCKL